MTRQLALHGRRSSPGRLPLAVVLGAAVPIVFLHVRFQPGFDLGFAGARAKLSDFAVLAVVLAGLRAGLRSGFEPLRRGLPVFAPAIAFLALVLVDTFVPVLPDDPYAWGTHLRTSLA